MPVRGPLIAQDGHDDDADPDGDDHGTDDVSNPQRGQSLPHFALIYGFSSVTVSTLLKRAPCSGT